MPKCGHGQKIESNADDKNICATAMGGDDVPSGIRGHVVEITDGSHGNVFKGNPIDGDVINRN